MPLIQLDARRTAVLVVDMQEKLLPVIAGHEAVLAQTCKLLEGAAALELPVLVTEQYRKGLGETVAGVRDRLPAGTELWEKLRFSACIEPVWERLSRLQSRTVVVCGIETHVCVLQTCLDLAERGYLPVLAADATGSRQALDRDMAMQRMWQAGVTATTVESALLEMVGEAVGPRFKSVLRIIR